MLGRWDSERLRVHYHENFPRLRLGPDPPPTPPSVLRLVGPQAEQLRQVSFCHIKVSTIYYKIFEFPPTTCPPRKLIPTTTTPRRRRRHYSTLPPTLVIACYDAPWFPPLPFRHLTIPPHPHSVVVPRTPNPPASPWLDLLLNPRTPGAPVAPPY